jgi:hypothetical protein
MSAFRIEAKRVLSPEQKERQRAYMAEWKAKKRAEREANPQPRKPSHAPASVRFEKNYIPEPNSGCWLWIGSLGGGAYGTIGVEGRTIKAHRLSLRLVGRDGPERCCLHRCDTPICVNPDHLTLGTHKDNMLDMVAKGRGANVAGSSNPRAKLSEAQVVQIRGDKRISRLIAADYGVSVALIIQIRSRRIWRNVDA